CRVELRVGHLGHRIIFQANMGHWRAYVEAWARKWQAEIGVAYANTPNVGLEDATGYRSGVHTRRRPRHHKRAARRVGGWSIPWSAAIPPRVASPSTLACKGLRALFSGQKVAGAHSFSRKRKLGEVPCHRD